MPEVLLVQIQILIFFHSTIFAALVRSINRQTYCWKFWIFHKGLIFRDGEFLKNKPSQKAKSLSCLLIEVIMSKSPF